VFLRSLQATPQLPVYGFSVSQGFSLGTLASPWGMSSHQRRTKKNQNPWQKISHHKNDHHRTTSRHKRTSKKPHAKSTSPLKSHLSPSLAFNLQKPAPI